MLVLCRHDRDLIVGVYSAFCKWMCGIRYFVKMRMLILCYHGEVMLQESVVPCMTALIVCTQAEMTKLKGASALSREKL